MKAVHPFSSCATPICCFCCDLGPKRTCTLIAYLMIASVFMGATNAGVGHWSLYLCSILNMFLHITAGVVLYLGALWERDSYKIAFCWLALFCLLVSCASCVVFLFFVDDAYIFGGKNCEASRTRMLIMVGLNTDKWEEILQRFEKNKFLPWIWPEKRNLEFIEKSIRSRNLKSLISIGCGSGLLEWLLTAATGIEVIGIETDGNWWKSKYSSGTFIPMILVDDSKKGEFGIETAKSALLFCYFNNLEAFLNYVNNFKGDCFIVIGPGQGRGTYTIPEPFHLPKGLEQSWKLSDHQEIRSSKDFIAVYVKK